MIPLEEYNLEYFFWDKANLWNINSYEETVERRLIANRSIPIIVLHSCVYLLRVREFMKRTRFYNRIAIIFLIISFIMCIYNMIILLYYPLNILKDTDFNESILIYPCLVILIFSLILFYFSFRKINKKLIFGSPLINIAAVILYFILIVIYFQRLSILIDQKFQSRME